MYTICTLGKVESKNACFFTSAKINLIADRRVAASQVLKTGLSEYIGGEVMFMTTADIIMIFISIVGLLISFGSLIVALLTFLDKRNKRKK
jgi:hypothetical protein